MIKLILRGQPQRTWNLTGASLTIGRDPSNDLVVEDRSISDFHAEIINESEGIQVIDLVSATGTYVNNERVRRRQSLRAWDTLRLGSVEFEVNDPSSQRPGTWSLQLGPGSPLSGQRFTLKPLTVIGRDPDCDLSIDDGQLSRRHAELAVVGGSVRVRDLESANGTFVNNVRVRERELYGGDEIRLGSRSYILIAPAGVPAAAIPDSDLTVVPNQGDFAATEEATEVLNDPEVAYLVEKTGLLNAEDDIPVHSPTKIGRAGENDIVIPDSSVSRLHAILRRDGSQWRIQDAGSSNGIMVNGQRATAATLSHGDSIVLGRAEFSFKASR